MLPFRQDSGFLSFHRKHLWAERKERKEIFHTRVHSEVPGKATNTLDLKKMMDEHVSNLLGRKSADLVESQMRCVYTHTHTHTHTQNYCQNSTHSDRIVLNEEKMRPICGWWARILEVFNIRLMRFSLKTDRLLWVSELSDLILISSSLKSRTLSFPWPLYWILILYLIATMFCCIGFA